MSALAGTIWNRSPSLGELRAFSVDGGLVRIVLVADNHARG